MGNEGKIPMRSYETARNIFSFLEFLAWASVAIGVLVAIGGAGAVSSFSRGGAGMIAALPGIMIAISGIFLVGIVQSGRASVDSAEYGQQALQIARDQLEISRQSLKLQGGSPVTSFSASIKKNDEGDRSSSENGATYANRSVESANLHADDESKAIQSEYEIGGKKLVQNADGTLQYEGIEFASLDGVKEHMRIQSVRDDPRFKVR